MSTWCALACTSAVPAFDSISCSRGRQGPCGEKVWTGVQRCVGMLSRAACGILVPRPGIKTEPCAVEAWSRNHWIAREVSVTDKLILPTLQPSGIQTFHLCIP
ncbi:serine palmitoyltransferase small subunit A isoform X1 [Orcinus orca]|uniref:serine palmitoyltransferase small subunit A isoform X1 n=1 Tax=Orcinus orca TaxID=9733 RepID=UPI002110E96E|nr:serine palmitoyltransferase small subunit A isoform X1 [Orcinus orca]